MLHLHDICIVPLATFYLHIVVAAMTSYFCNVYTFVWIAY